MAPPFRRRAFLGELLIEAGAIDETRLKVALTDQRRWGGKLGRILVELGFIEEKAMVEVLARQLQLSTVDLDTHAPAEGVTGRLPLDLAERYGIFPVAFDAASNRLTLATADPTNTQALRELEVATGFSIEPRVASPAAIERAIRRVYLPAASALEQQGNSLEPQPQPSPPYPSSSPPFPPFPSMKGFNRPPEATTTSVAKELLSLQERVATLEDSMASQVRSLRAVLELLFDSGLIRRDAYLKKLHVDD